MADQPATGGSGTAQRGTAAPAPRVDTGRPVPAAAPAAVPLRCLRCQGLEWPERTGTGYVSVWGTPQLQGACTVLLNGVDVTNECQAADAKRGLVLLMPTVHGQRRICGWPQYAWDARDAEGRRRKLGWCGHTVAQQLARGSVEVRMH